MRWSSGKVQRTLRGHLKDDVRRRLGEEWVLDYLCLVKGERRQVGVMQEGARIQVDWGLAPPFRAHCPRRVDHSPELRTCRECDALRHIYGKAVCWSDTAFVTEEMVQRYRLIMVHWYEERKEIN